MNLEQEKPGTALCVRACVVCVHAHVFKLMYTCLNQSLIFISGKTLGLQLEYLEAITFPVINTAAVQQMGADTQGHQHTWDQP